VLLHSFYIQLQLVNLISSANWESQIFCPELAWTEPYMSRIGPKWGENAIFRSREWYNIISMYNYY